MNGITVGLHHLLHIWVIVAFLCDQAHTRVDITDIPPGNRYEQYTGIRVSYPRIGEPYVSSPRLCAVQCDNTDRCAGFNYNRGTAKCVFLEYNVRNRPGQESKRHDTRYDHYARLDAKFNCPPDTYPHPYKDICYKPVADPGTHPGASVYCRRSLAVEGNLVVVPDQATLDILLSVIPRPLIEDKMWMSLVFEDGSAVWLGKGTRSPFLWQNNMIDGMPETRRLFCGLIDMQQGGQFDYELCGARHTFLCEIRPYSYRTVNDVCPEDTVLYGGRCGWRGAQQLNQPQASAACINRGGTLVELDTPQQLQQFTAAINAKYGESLQESWIGLRYTSDQWRWSKGLQDEEMNRYWLPGEQSQGAAEACASMTSSPALGDNHDVTGRSYWWMSRACGHTVLPYLCSGPAGEVLSHECDSKACPANSVCVEGPRAASCVCLPGYTLQYRHGTQICADMAQCSSFGDPHYTLWDGGRMGYQGRCTHLLAGTCTTETSTHNTPLVPFQVYTNNVHKEGTSEYVSYTQWAEVHVYGDVIRLALGSLLLVNGETRVAQVELHPYQDSRYIRVVQQAASQRLILTTDFGLRVEYRDYQLTVTTSLEYQRADMCGICGDMDGDPYDQDTRRDQHRWMVEEDQRNPSCMAGVPPIVPECDNATRQTARNRCFRISNLDIFHECGEQEGVDLGSFVDDCIEDSCAEGTMVGISSTVCDITEALVALCHQKGITIDLQYRELLHCPMICPANSEYTANMNLDQPTCQNRDGLYQTSAGYGEGCMCITGYILSAGACVPVEECGCVYAAMDMYMQAGTAYTNSDCTRVVRCEENSDLQVEDIQCGDNAVCTLHPDAGTRECVCLPHHIGDPYDMCDPQYDCVYQQSDDFGNIYLTIGEHIMNSMCQNITCHSTNTTTQSDPLCDVQAQCLYSSDDTYACWCHTGVMQDMGAAGCDGAPPPASAVGDPHFLVTSQRTGEHFCFDVHGHQGQVWRIIEDQHNGVYVNGELFETNTSTPDRPQSYFSRIALMSRDRVIICDTNSITVGSSAPRPWWDTFDEYGWITRQSRDAVLVQLLPDVTVTVTRSYGARIAGYYLGVIVTNSAGLHQQASGLIGQFLGTTFHSSYEEHTGTVLSFDDWHPAIQVQQVQRYYQSHQANITCWHYNCAADDDTLLGPAASYTAYHITDTHSASTRL